MRATSLLDKLRLFQNPLAALCVVLLVGNVSLVSTPGFAAAGMCIAGAFSGPQGGDTDEGPDGPGGCPYCTACAASVPIQPVLSSAAATGSQPTPAHFAALTRRAVGAYPVGARAPPV